MPRGRPDPAERHDGVGRAPREEGAPAPLTQILDKFCPPGTTSSLDKVIPSSVMKKAKGIAMYAVRINTALRSTALDSS